MSEVAVHVSADATALAELAAAKLLVRLNEAQTERGAAALVLTGGGIASAVYAAVLNSPGRQSVDWSRVDVWWGDERFLPAGDPDRNETQARATLLDPLGLDPARVHPMPPAGAVGSSGGAVGSSGGAVGSSGGAVGDPEAAAAAYAEQLAAAARPGTARLPRFDLLLLGVGEDGHVASIFPEHPAVYESRPVAGVRGSPKPPPMRVTLTLPAINTAAEVWLIAAGPTKASAVGAALTGGAGPVQLPAAGVHGVERTLWLLDRAAAAEVPPNLRSLR